MRIAMIWKGGVNLLDGGFRKVHPGRLRAQAGQRQRVLPEMALKVQDGPPRDVAQQRQLERLERGLPRLEARHVVERRPHVDVGPAVPALPVDLDEVPPFAHIPKVGASKNPLPAPFKPVVIPSVFPSFAPAPSLIP